jgi:protein SCO1/2/putative membrane protein
LNAPEWVSQLPAVNAGLNALATVLLVAGLAMIKGKQVEAHKWTMLAAFGVSIAFLACYLTYHVALHQYTGSGSKHYPADAPLRPLYLAILLTHVFLAAAVPVLAVVTIRHGLKQNWTKHRRIAKITFPIWLYVSVTGVVIYWMLYHFAGVAA